MRLIGPNRYQVDPTAISTHTMDVPWTPIEIIQKEIILTLFGPEPTSINPKLKTVRSQLASVGPHLEDVQYVTVWGTVWGRGCGGTVLTSFSPF